MATYSPQKSKIKVAGWVKFLPLIVFVGSGMADTIVNYVQRIVVSGDDFNLMSQMIFGVSFLTGVLLSIFNPDVRLADFNMKTTGAGLLMGIPNYGSLVFIMMALETDGIEASVIFPLANIGVVVLSAISARFLFGETLSRIRQLGLLLALAAILMLLRV